MIVSMVIAHLNGLVSASFSSPPPLLLLLIGLGCHPPRYAAAKEGDRQLLHNDQRRSEEGRLLL
jgi:hypothetical protein